MNFPASPSSCVGIAVLDEPGNFMPHPPAENAAESLVKGSRALLTGRLRTDAWTPTEGPLAGIEQRRIRIAVDELAASVRYDVARSVRPERTTGATDRVWPPDAFASQQPPYRRSPTQLLREGTGERITGPESNGVQVADHNRVGREKSRAGVRDIDFIAVVLDDGAS